MAQLLDTTINGNLTVNNGNILLGETSRSGNSYLKLTNNTANFSLVNNASGHVGIWDNINSKWCFYDNGTGFNVIGDDLRFNGKSIVKNKVLWSGNYYMSAAHVCNLSEKVSEQTNGIVLLFQPYSSSTVQSYDYNYKFIPKAHITYNPGGGVDCIMMSGSYMARKYIYVNDTTVVGNANNVTTQTIGGITFTNSAFILTKVYGV